MLQETFISDNSIQFIKLCQDAFTFAIFAPFSILSFAISLPVFALATFSWHGVIYDLNLSTPALNISLNCCVMLRLLTVSARCLWNYVKGCERDKIQKDATYTSCWSTYVWRQGCLGWCWEIWPVVSQPLLSFPSFPFWPASQKLSAHRWGSGTV